MARKLTFLAFVACLATAAAKVQDGWLTLTSEDCEQFVAKFSFSPGNRGRIAGHFYSDATTTIARDHSDYFDGHPHALQVALFSDMQWEEYRKMLAEGSLCKDRMATASFNKKIRPSHSDKANVAKGLARVHGKNQFNFAAEIPPLKDRSHYWYVVLSDCYLEEYDAHPPRLDYYMEFLNGDSHLPADEDGLVNIHAFVFALLAIGTAVGAVKLRRQIKVVGQMHLTLMILSMAYSTEMLSVLMELTHLWVYVLDGKGMRWRHGRLPFDFAADAFQNASELLLSSILIAISFGWTMHGNFTRGVVTLGGQLRVTRGQLAVIVVSTVGFLQLVLELAGRGYEEDFNSFHDHEHWPGACLMLLRVALSALLWFGVRDTLQLGNKSAVNALLSRLRLVGMSWLLSFPFLVLVVAPMVSPSRRHAFVTLGALLSQFAALTTVGAQLLNMDGEFFKGSTLAKMGTMFADASTEEVYLGASKAATGVAGMISQIRKKVAVD